MGCRQRLLCACSIVDTHPISEADIMARTLYGGLLGADGAAAVVATWRPDLEQSPAMLGVEHRWAPIRVGLEHVSRAN